MLVYAGERLCRGTYLCSTCRIAIAIDSRSSILPSCPCCESLEFIVKESTLAPTLITEQIAPEFISLPKLSL